MTSSSAPTRKSFVLQAEPGAGKTLLGQTLPGPILSMDLEKGGDHGLDVVRWDGEGAWPTDLRPTTTVLVHMQSVDEVLNMLQRLLNDAEHPFNAVLLDSAHQLNRIAAQEAQHWNNRGEKKQPDPNTPPSEADWGRAAVYMERVLYNGMRALATDEAAKPVHTATLVGVDYDVLPHVAMVQPWVRKWMYYWFDMIMYLYAEDTDDETRVLVLNGHKELCRVKTRLTPFAKSKLGRSVRNPDLGIILKVVLAGEKKAAEAAKEGSNV